MNTVEHITPSENTWIDVDAVRADFPILQQKVHGKPLVYLDNAATAQKPKSVISVVNDYYETTNANIHRGVHSLSEKATIQYEQTREKIKRFIHAHDAKEIIFVRGATEAINLVAHSYGRSQLQAGDEILITEIEHHSNIVPWQLLCEQTGAVLKVAPMNDQGEIIIEEYKQLLSEKTKIVGIVHISNALGTINPVQQMTQLAHAVGAKVLIDGAQAAPHAKIDVQAIDCDFYVLSGHKAYGPTGVGILYGKKDLLETMPPYQGGGEMITKVSFTETLYNIVPHKFEAGTPNIAGVIGLGAALDYIEHIGINNIAAYEQELLHYATKRALQYPGLTIIGTAKEKASILSFVLEDIHAHDIGTILDHEGVAIRTGHHCAMPAMEHFDVAATARASFAFYNTQQEIDALFNGLDKVKEVFAR